VAPWQSVPYCASSLTVRWSGSVIATVTGTDFQLCPGGGVYDDYDQTRHIPAASGAPPGIDGRKLWSGGVATAIVATLVAFVGLLVARGIFQVPVLAPTEAGLVGDATTVGLCSLVALAALVGTGLMHLLLLTTPKPETFFTAIAGLVTLAVALQPFTTGIDIEVKIATMVVYLAAGMAIVLSLNSVAGYANR